ncbi:HAD family hydrolase [Antarcticimicrobium sediminis]|uniref:HAD family phosphatase n=1 Tax=Antarcticimicrobium sediminis TaxID=2546227 RepID=A0A4R5ESF2_9RHOB|nr:HAD family phosphatase [Antarcticimicrobium sediminis]TDE37580.1 HAD family phosphatase [Antarcticimicrobium sediminis]
MQPQAVIFDIGNVLIEWQPERFFDREIGEARRRALFAAVDLHAMNDAVDRGGNFTEVVFATAEQYPDWHDEIHMWHDRWIEMAAPEIPHSIRLLRALRAKGTPVFALTNFGVQTFDDIAAPHYPFLSEFDRTYVSGHMKTIKPEPEIYAMLEADCGIAPEALIFTDDRQDNIDMATQRGWQTHLFTGPQGWADRLVGAGLLTEEDAQ